MNRRTLLATFVAVLAVPGATLAAAGAALAAAGAALAAAGAAGAARTAGPTVSLRIEGLKRELLSPRAVTTHSGWVTRYGAPIGSCPATSAQGALDVGTKHRWGGTWDSQFGAYEVLSILGETHTFTSKYFWELFANNVPASVGTCELHLRRGEQLLFAAVPAAASGSAYPTAIRAPKNAVVGVPFSVKVVRFNAKGQAQPLANARVTGSAVSTSTNPQGVATVIVLHPGSLVLHATHRWSASTAYVRAAPVTVRVS